MILVKKTCLFFRTIFFGKLPADQLLHFFFALVVERDVHVLFPGGTTSVLRHMITSHVCIDWMHDIIDVYREVAYVCWTTRHSIVLILFHVTSTRRLCALFYICWDDLRHPLTGRQCLAKDRMRRDDPKLRGWGLNYYYIQSELRAVIGLIFWCAMQPGHHGKTQLSMCCGFPSWEGKSEKCLKKR
jgi:hypothetical protein